MMNKIKRIAALTVAGILLICISFASLAEGMPEESSAPEEANASAAAEITGEPNDIPAAAETAETNEAPEAASINDSIPAENNEAPADNREPETTEQNNARESAEGNGNSAAPVGDTFYGSQDLNGKRTACYGGRSYEGLGCGCAHWSFGQYVGTRNEGFGGRLFYVPTATA